MLEFILWLWNTVSGNGGEGDDPEFMPYPDPGG